MYKPGALVDYGIFRSPDSHNRGEEGRMAQGSIREKLGNFRFHNLRQVWRLVIRTRWIAMRKARQTRRASR